MLDNYLTGFDPWAYYDQNYRHAILHEDTALIEYVTRTSVIANLGIAPKSLKRVIDIGNAGVMIAPGLMSPYVADDGEILLADVGYPQLHAITTTIRKGQRGNLGIWRKYDALMAQDPTWVDAIPRACQLGKPHTMSVFDLPPNSFDGASMFYVAESITATKQDFMRAVTKYFESVRSGGLILWAAMIGSQGYDSPGETFESYWIDLQDVTDIADEYVDKVTITYCASSAAARPQGGPLYTGMALLTGVRR